MWREGKSKKGSQHAAIGSRAGKKKCPWDVSDRYGEPSRQDPCLPSSYSTMVRGIFFFFCSSTSRFTHRISDSGHEELFIKNGRQGLVAIVVAHWATHFD
jgi:hypothetical protein